MDPDQSALVRQSDLGLQCLIKKSFQQTTKVNELLPCNYQLSKRIVHEIKFGDIAVMLI